MICYNENMKEVEFYTTTEGKCPYFEWLETLSLNFQIRIDNRLNRIRDGNFGDCKKLQNSQLSELRFTFGKGYRIYFKELDNLIIIILAGGDKSDQNKTIKKADEYLEDYLKREYKNDNKIR